MNSTTLDPQKELCRGEKIEAQYGTPDLPMYEGNPLIETLPSLRCKKAVMEKLEQRPEYNRANDCCLPLQKRIALLDNVGRFFQPLPRHVRLEQEISRMVRSGYTDRNPLANSFYKRIKEKAGKVIGNLDRQSTRVFTTPSGLLTGISGTGKTFSLEKILAVTLPQVVIHRNYSGIEFYHEQLVWLKVNCPPSGTARGLCTNFFRAVDAILDKNNESNYAGARTPLTKMASGLASVALLHSLGLLVIDEMHNIKAGRSGGKEQLLNFIVEIESMGVPVLLVANGKVDDILGTGFRQLRRSTGLSQPHWYRMLENSKEWRVFSTALWHYQYLKVFQPLTDELRAELYYQTQGIPDFAVKLYHNVQKELINEEDGEQITPEVIAKVAARDFARNARILKALRTKDLTILEKVNDLCPEDFCDTELPSEELERLATRSNGSADKNKMGRNKRS
jgi:hypothetical protein